MSIIRFFNGPRQGLAGVLKFAACVLSLPSAVMEDIASLIWNDNNKR